MRNKRYYFLVMMSGLILLSQFNNCDVYSKNDAFSPLNSTDCQTNCSTGSVDLLQISAVPNIQVASTELYRDFGGNCNEGGFPDNLVIWRIRQSASGPVLRECTWSGFACGRCAAGRYSVSLNFTGMTLSAGMVIEMEIIGIEGGQTFSAPLSGLGGRSTTTITTL